MNGTVIPPGASTCCLDDVSDTMVDDFSLGGESVPLTERNAEELRLTEG